MAYVAKAMIVKVMVHFTISPVMVVDLQCAALQLRGRFILKLYDRRFSPNMRSDMKAGQWNSQVEEKYIDFVSHTDGQRFIEGLPSNYISVDSSNWNVAQKEAFLQDYMQKCYRSETEVYKRAKRHQGTLIPQLYASVTISRNHLLYQSYDACNFFECPGILLLYIEGKPMDSLSKDIGSETLQRIFEDAVHIIHTIGEKNLCNLDVQKRNFLVNIDSGHDKPLVSMIDFASCLFRKSQDDVTWELIRSQRDEEGALRYAMQNKWKGKFTYEQSALCKEWTRKYNTDMC